MNLIGKSALQGALCVTLVLCLTHCFGSGSQDIINTQASLVASATPPETPCEEKKAEFEFDQWQGFNNPITKVSVNVPNYHCRSVYPNSEAQKAALQQLRCEYNPCFKGDQLHASCYDDQSESVQAGCDSECGLAHQVEMPVRETASETSLQTVSFPDWGCWDESTRENALKAKACDLDYCAQACGSERSSDRLKVMTVYDRLQDKNVEAQIEGGRCLEGDVLAEKIEQIKCEHDPCLCSVRDPAKVDLPYTVNLVMGGSVETTIPAGRCLSASKLAAAKAEKDCEEDYCSASCGVKRANERTLSFLTHDRSRNHDVNVQIENGHCMDDNELNKAKAEAICDHDMCSEACGKRRANDRVYRVNDLYDRAAEKTTDDIGIADGACMSTSDLQYAVKALRCMKDPCLCEHKDSNKVDFVIRNIAHLRGVYTEKTFPNGMCTMTAEERAKKEAEIRCNADFRSSYCPK